MRKRFTSFFITGFGVKEASLSFSYSHSTEEYECYSDHFNDEIIEDEFAYFIV